MYIRLVFYCREGCTSVFLSLSLLGPFISLEGVGCLLLYEEKVRTVPFLTRATIYFIFHWGDFYFPSRLLSSLTLISLILLLFNLKLLDHL